VNKSEIMELLTVIIIIISKFNVPFSPWLCKTV
jgi:hypothetical protein